MPLQLIRIRLTTTAQTTTVLDPNVRRFFYVTTADSPAGTTLTIDAGDFFDDTGNQASALPALNPANSTFRVYINGVLQMSDLFTYTPGPPGTGRLVIAIPAGGDPILAGTPIILEFVGYNPVSTTTVTATG